MSGVRVGTRLDQLETLRSRLDQEIAVERRNRNLAMPTASAAPMVVKAYVAPLPTTAVIRAWAIANGYMPPHQRHGRIPAEVIDCYREAAS